MSKTIIKDINVNWINIKNACRNTISMKDSKIEPTSEWKRKLLICRHSPIRKGIISWKWEQIPYAISTHFARHHEGCEKYISTSREDRTGIPREQRSQMDNVSMEMDANLESIMNISERRLCLQADKTTRAYWEDLLEEIKDIDNDLYWASVPQCVRYGACIELFSDCNFYDNLMKDVDKEKQQDIVERYNIYNEYRQKVKKL